MLTCFCDFYQCVFNFIRELSSPIWAFTNLFDKFPLCKVSSFSYGYLNWTHRYFASTCRNHSQSESNLKLTIKYIAILIESLTVKKFQLHIDLVLSSAHSRMYLMTTGGGQGGLLVWVRAVYLWYGIGCCKGSG